MSRIKLIGLPYEGPEDFIRGTSLAPPRLRWAMESIEDYSIYQHKNIPDYEDYGDIRVDPDGNPGETLSKLFRSLKEFIDTESRYLFLGGDHAVTYPVVLAFNEKYPDLTVVHFDAHLERRTEYMGNRWSHACVIKRLEETLSEDKILTFGYRSRAPEEPESGAPFNILENLSKMIDRINPPVYLTIDLDVLDPSEFPAVSNPEPGGITFKELQESLYLLRGKLIGIDIVEYNPLASDSIFPAVTGALLIREALIVLSDSL